MRPTNQSRGLFRFPNPGFEREMTCRSWGQYNFETFDGLYYHFPGRCSYTLLRDCEETTQVHNDPDCRSAPYTCHRSVSLFLPWDGELRLHANNVTFEGQRSARISQYVLVTQQRGFTLAWDGRGGSVYIKLSPEFVGRTCGLCGNFNADVQDDLKTSYGVLTHDVEMFGNSWVAAEDVCVCVCVCETSSLCVSWLQEVEDVCATLLEPPFQSCHDLVSPLSYMASCSNDLCIGDAVCQVFSEYARACAHAGHPLHDWRRHIPQCGTFSSRECISCCPASCNLERTCIDSKLACLDGCYCPDGLIYEDGGCVTPSDCPCEHRGLFYPSGRTLQEECSSCTCEGGVWNCTDYSCPGECSVTGDMYFHSFDGRRYTFSATCQYVLAKSRNSGKFTVTVQNAPCGANLDGACIQSVSLVIDEDPRTEITLSHVGEVFMAGHYRISLPYSDDVFHIQELSSSFLQVKTAFGLRLQYSWREFRLYLQADELWRDGTAGLCGTFNGNIQDDFLSPSGMIESTPQLFGNAWRVSSACSTSLSASPLDPCDTHQQAAAYASEMCDVLNQDLFSGCHEYLSPTSFHQQCRSDTCKCGAPCLCSALAHYARHCRRFNVVVDFRSQIPDCAAACPATMRYGTCVSSCQRRCSALSVPQHCGEECEEGCVCPPETFYNHRTHTCVHRSECPCSFLGADYEPGDVIMTSAGVHSSSSPPLTDMLCPAGQRYQNCSEGGDGFLSGRGVACEHTCESFLLNLTCSSHEPCVTGCICPPGSLKHGDECFEPASCPCLWKGKEYYPGDRVSSPCHQCVCQQGAFHCVFRPCPSTCTAYGDRHYRTFDGLPFDYVGGCRVYLVKSSGDELLSVTAENVDCFHSGVTCRKSLLINIGRSSVAFDEDSGKPNPSSVLDGKQRMFIWPAGYFTVVHFPDDDVTVLWDRKTTVHVQVGPRWQGKLSGLCGNFDAKTVNEMRTPDNVESPTPQEFGNSWTAAECVNSPDIRHPCSLSPLREPFAKRQCGVLLSEVFQACHPVVDVTWFYMNCLADTCACSRGGDCECFCTSVAAYAQRCCHHGVPVDWRSPSLCRESISSDLPSSSSSPFFLSTDTSRVSFEAADRPNYFLSASPGGQVRLAKWEESDAFWDGATFVLHRNTWTPGYDALESHARPGFFLHATPLRLHLLKYRHADSFRKATLFRLTGHADALPGPRCQWRYDSCVVPCFKTCSDPSAEACVAIPQVEGCLPVCPPHMVLDEVTRRCVFAEDCELKLIYLSPTASSVQGPTSIGTPPPVVVHPTTETTEATTHPAAVAPVVTASSPSPAPVSETAPVTDRTTVPSTVVITDTSTKPVTVEQLPLTPPTITTTTPIPSGLPSLASVTSSPLPISPPVETGTTSLPTVTSAKTTEPVTPVAPFSTSKTPPYVSPETTSPAAATEKILHTTPTELRTSTTAVPETPTSSPFHVAPTTTAPSAPSSAATDWRTTTRKVTILESTVSDIPGASTTTAAPPLTKITDIPTSPASTTTTYADRTSWSTAAPTAEKTTLTTTSRPPEMSTVSTGPPVTTKPTVPPMPPTETTAGPRLPAADSSTHPASTVRTSEPWHRDTSSASLYTGKTLPEVTSKTVILEVTSTKTTEAPLLPVTSTPFVTSATSAPAAVTRTKTTTLPEISTAEIAVTTSRIDLATPSPPPAPGVPETHPTTSSTRAPPGVVTTTLRPVTLQPTTETTQPATGGAEVTTRATTTPPPSWSPAHTTTTSSAVTRPTTVQDVVTTRSVSTERSTPATMSTTIARMTDVRSTPRVPVTTGVTPTITSTEGSTVRPVTERVTIVTRPPASTTSSTTLGPPTAPSSPASTTTSGKPSASVSTSAGSVATATTAPPPDVILGCCVTSCFSVQPPYAEIVDECTKYICVSNQLVLFNKSQSCPFAAERPNCGLLGFAVLVNGDKCCPKWECPCRCSMFPDLNVITFDGNSVAVYKAASYIVSRLPNETVSVLVQECPADSESAVTDLNVLHNATVIRRLTASSFQLYVDSRYAKPRFKKFGFEIYDTGNMYLIRSPAGLKLQWYHSTGMMVIDTGGSGFCDGDPTNDLTLANGTTLGAGEDPDAFIDSWQVPNTTGYVSHSRRRELNCSTSDCSGCLLMLQSDAFHRCHAFVPPSTFCEVWVRDAEYVNNQCVALAAYVASCHKFNVCIEWRRPDYCPFSCPGALRYRACLPACTSQSCPNQDFDSDPDPDQCSGLTEGCECSEGTLLHRPYSALCISPDKCACTDSAGVPRAHGEVWKASKDACCVYRCDHNDAVVPVEHDCSGAAPPPVCRRAAEVLISLADAAGGCCPQEVCVCNQSLCDLIPPDCKYGEKLASYYRQDSCCPDYVCECDPELCEPDALACRDDHTLIATRADGSCCPAFICMCSSCPETPPLCQDGEVLTVDPNTTDRCCPNQCACKRFNQFLMFTVTPDLGCVCVCVCVRVRVRVCAVREAVCVFGERGVLRPGQTLVEHHGDGVCLSRQCSRSIDPTSGFNLLRSDSINCSAHCQPNQVYVPPKDQTTCCGVCKNVSCLYEHENGTTLLYKPGKSWVSNCVKFDCRDTRSGPTLISYSYSCPPFNETECMKIGGTVVSYMDECCKTCKEDGKSCQKVTVRMTIRKNDCRSNRPVNIVSCDGKCPSASIYNYNINTYARFCKCCRETGLQRRSVQLYCSGNATWVSYGIQEPTDCSCQWS
uniref:Otogelin n=1 Tax=Cyclopterus lumpus TaxID=8103 RepID=A0A8C2WKQ8_CYCLU